MVMATARGAAMVTELAQAAAFRETGTAPRVASAEMVTLRPGDFPVTATPRAVAFLVLGD